MVGDAICVSSGLWITSYLRSHPWANDHVPGERPDLIISRPLSSPLLLLLRGNSHSIKDSDLPWKDGTVSHISSLFWSRHLAEETFACKRYVLILVLIKESIGLGFNNCFVLVVHIDLILSSWSFANAYSCSIFGCCQNALTTTTDDFWGHKPEVMDSPDDGTLTNMEISHCRR